MRVPLQAVLPFDAKARTVNRRIEDKSAGRKLRPKLGRPRGKSGRVSHAGRAQIGLRTALHVTVRVGAHVPNLRTRRRFAAIKAAFVKFATLDGFRLVQFSILGNQAV